MTERFIVTLSTIGLIACIAGLIVIGQILNY